MRVTLDSNILVYAAQEGERRHAMAAALLRRAIRGDCVQTLQSLGECFHALCRKRGFARHEAQAILAYYRELFEVVVAPEVGDLDEALRACIAHGFPYWDAMLWATARRAGCRLILTEDVQNGRDLEGVMFLDPFDPANAKLLDLALPPLEA